MARNGIPEDVQNELEARVAQFNHTTFGRENISYELHFRGRFCYLNRQSHGRLEPVFRLAYSGNINTLESAIFKWSSETFKNVDDFAGAHFLNGTIEGAMQAGLAAYPV